MIEPNEPHKDFKLTFEIAIIEHLGLNLYSEVHSAVSELIANSYDAEATKVNIKLPLGIDLGLDGQAITIEDNGHGMTYAECRDSFLKIGRNRRKQSRKSKNGLRAVIGKKGIGKLAGFGVADQVHIITIADHKKTEFVLNLREIRDAKPKEYQGSDQLDSGDEQDVVREYMPKLVTVEEHVSVKQGTTVVLEKIRPLDAVDLDDFKMRLSRKFAIFSDDFDVTIENSGTGERTSITKFDVPTQFRFPTNGWGEESITTPNRGKQNVLFWIGFTKNPIKEDALRGISVIANGKSVQEPFDFRLSGGTEGQFGLQYMTGEVIANWLDEGAVDVTASDRASIRWSDIDASRLLDWGQDAVRNALKKWAGLRSAMTMEDIASRDPEIQAEIQSYKGEARDELQRVVDRVATALSQVGEDRVHEVILSIVNAYRHDHIRKVLSKVISGIGGLELFVEALHEWDLIDAVLTFEEMSVKLSAVQTLKVLVLGKATEVKSKSGQLSLHEHLAEHPWLIDPMYSDLEHERHIDKFILERYGVDPARDDKRADFILLFNSERIRIVEIKSAKDPLDARGAQNLMDYHFRIKTEESKRNNASSVRTVLIYNGKVTSDGEAMLDTIKRDKEYEVYTWQELFDRNARIYKEQLRHVRAKNPNDPRIVALTKTMDERLEATVPSQT